MPLSHPTRTRGLPAVLVFLLALAWTLLNCCKPLTIDDTAYYYYARQLAHNATDPYGFSIFWYQQPVPANHLLVPPLLPAWWSLAIRLFGDVPAAWKLWLLPFTWLFVRALYRLARRFARGLEWPIVVGLVFSPVFLPGLNLMLDVPALALTLTAIDLFLTARSPGQAILAGLLAGLAMQTKYTALLAPAVLGGYALLSGRWRLGLLAIGTAVLLFGLWESFVAWKYGESHFFYHLHHPSPTRSEKEPLTEVLRRLLGSSVGVSVLLLGAALGLPGRSLALFVPLVVLACVIPAVCANDGPGRCAIHLQGRDLSPALLLFDLLGLLWLLGTMTVALLLCLRRRGLPGGHLPAPTFWFSLPRSRRADWFLAGWFLVELAGFFLLTPFPAVRRIMGLVVVGTLLAARRAPRTCASARRRTLVWGITAGCVLVGLLVAGVDTVDAFALENAAEQSAALVREQNPEGVNWYAGHWGFQFYAERAGLVPVVPDESILQPGDWLVLPDPRLDQQQLSLPKDSLVEVRSLVIGDRLPLRTIDCYYGGVTALEHQRGPRWTVTIYRVQARLVLQGEPASP